MRGHLDASDGAVGAVLDMVEQHARVVHLVDVVAASTTTKRGPIERMMSRFWNTASAVPRYQLSSMRCCAGQRSMNSLISPRRKPQPRCRCRNSECALYCVTTAMRRMPEFRQFDSAKSMIRYLPPKWTAGLTRLLVSAPSRVPRPPASTIARVDFCRSLRFAGVLHSELLCCVPLYAECHAGPVPAREMKWADDRAMQHADAARGQARRRIALARRVNAGRGCRIASAGLRIGNSHAAHVAESCVSKQCRRKVKIVARRTAHNSPRAQP